MSRCDCNLHCDPFTDYLKQLISIDMNKNMPSDKVDVVP